MRDTSEKTPRKKKENLYSWICVVIGILVVIPLITVAMVGLGIRGGAVYFLIFGAVFFGYMRLCAKIIDGKLDKEFGTENKE